MAIERTLSIIKPDATRRNLTGKIIAKFEDAGLRVVAQKRIHLSPAQAGQFYAVHKERPFYGELVEFMASAPVVVGAPKAAFSQKPNASASSGTTTSPSAVTASLIGASGSRP